MNMLSVTQASMRQLKIVPSYINNKISVLTDALIVGIYYISQV